MKYLVDSLRESQKIWQGPFHTFLETEDCHKDRMLQLSKQFFQSVEKDQIMKMSQTARKKTINFFFSKQTA